MALTNDKLVIVGAAGMIGSNMVQTALMMGLTTNICLYDVFSPEGVAEEMRQSGFGDVNIVATTDVKEAFTDAKYIISSGGAPRKEGMTREDLLKGNCEIAEGLGKDIKTYCPDVKHVVIIFNPADLTGLNAFFQTVHLDVGRTNAVQGRYKSAQHVVKAVMLMGVLDTHHVLDILDHTNC